jgi:hypothetical protein
MQMQHGWLETFVIEFLILRGKDSVVAAASGVADLSERPDRGGRVARRRTHRQESYCCSKVQAGFPEDLRPYQIETSSWLVVPVHGAQK